MVWVLMMAFVHVPGNADAVERTLRGRERQNSLFKVQPELTAGSGQCRRAA